MLCAFEHHGPMHYVPCTGVHLLMRQLAGQGGVPHNRSGDKQKAAIFTSILLPLPLPHKGRGIPFQDVLRLNTKEGWVVEAKVEAHASLRRTCS